VRILLASVAALVLAAGGYAFSGTAAGHATQGTQTFTFTNEGTVTYDIPTVTETVTVTVTEPPPPPPPPAPSPPPPPPPAPPPVCTKTAGAGADLSTFLGTLTAGDVGCLHGGNYTDGAAVSWSANGTASSRITLQSYPGESAKIVGTELDLVGNYLTARDLTVKDVSSGYGIGFSGSNDRAEHNTITNVGASKTAGAAILLHTGTNNDTVTRNYVDGAGPFGGTLYHGVYIQGNGHTITRNVFSNIRGGYGIQLYPSSSNTVVAENTAVGSATRSGIVIQTSGSNNAVVNNIFANNAGYGMANRSCTGCTISNNIVWNNGSGDCENACPTNTRHVDPLFSDAVFHVGAGSPAVDTATATYAFFPDLDGVPGVVGAGPDLGAYER
jgi:hypothetical protein